MAQTTEEEEEEASVSSSDGRIPVLLHEDEDDDDGDENDDGEGGGEGGGGGGTLGGGGEGLLVRAVTWNQGGWEPNGRRPPFDSPEQVAQKLLLESSSRTVAHPHLVAFGAQECERSIAASAVRPSKDRWESILRNDILGPRGYVEVRCHALQGMHLAVYAHRSIVPLVRDVKSASVPTGWCGLLGNKGGVGVSLTAEGYGSICFVTSHLAHGQNRAEKRTEDFEKISRELARRLGRSGGTAAGDDGGGDGGAEDSGGGESRGGRRRRAGEGDGVYDPVVSEEEEEEESFADDYYDGGDDDNVPASSGRCFPLFRWCLGRRETTAAHRCSSQCCFWCPCPRRCCSAFAKVSDSSHVAAAEINPLTAAFDHVIWAGDLNYRIDLPRGTVENLLLDDDAGRTALREKDQLCNLMMRKREDPRSSTFVGFGEGDVRNFNPTYKFDRDSDAYDTSKKRRIPAWTDRILYSSTSSTSATVRTGGGGGDDDADNDEEAADDFRDSEDEKGVDDVRGGGRGGSSLGLELLTYGSAAELRRSDHRPVYATFRLRPRPSRSSSVVEEGRLPPGGGDDEDGRRRR